MTLKEIAKMAGVSNATISKILNGKDQNISDATRKRVLEIIEREGYIPNGIAKSLRVSKTKTIGLIMPDVMNLFFSEIARGVEDAAEKRGYSVILCNSDNKEAKEEKYIQILQEKKVDGIILTASENSVTKSLENKDIPLVLLDRDMIINRPVGKILLDNEEGFYNGTKYLISQGCKSIGFISSDNKSKSSYQRFLGYERALKENEIPVDEDMIYLQSYTIDTGYLGAKALLERAKIDGLACGNDLIAIGAINALKEENIKVPDEVKVLGFDDISVSKYLNPPLTTVRQPIYEMGEESAYMLIDIIAKKEIDYIRVLSSELILRGSA